LSRNVPDHIIRQILESTDFVALAGRYCQLKARGKKYLALCPFHKEKTPSFTIDAEKGLFYCFGCKEGGNVFTFLQKMEGLDFGQALEKLAAEAGIDLERWRGLPGASGGEREKLYEVNELAAAFYRKCLQKTEGGKEAASYMARRGINEDSIARWGLGYAPEGWDHLLRFAAGRRYRPQLLERAGLVVAREGATGHYDRFRNRVMFPIRERGGRTIGFGARAMTEDEEPKYLNTPQTAIFNKGSCFYGLSMAKEAIRTKGTAIVMEGYTDVIMSHQFGVQEAIGVLGTSLTMDHARTLRRLCERVILVFDADEAGLKSAIRSVQVLLGEDLDVAVAMLPQGQDPCALLAERGVEEFRKILDGSQDAFRFRLELAAQTHDLRTVGGRSAAFREVAELALRVKDEAKRDIIVRTLAEEIGITPASAWAYIERNWPRGSRRGGDYEPAGAAESPSADSLCAQWLLGVTLAEPETTRKVADAFDQSLLDDCTAKKVLERRLDYFREHGTCDARQFVHSLKQEDELDVAAQAWATADRVRARQGSVEAVLEDQFRFLDEKRERRRIEELSPAQTARDAPTTSTTSAPVAGRTEDTLAEEQLKAYVEMMRDRDRRKKI